MKKALLALAALALLGSADAAEPRGTPVFITLPTGFFPGTIPPA